MATQKSNEDDLAQRKKKTQQGSSTPPRKTNEGETSRSSLFFKTVSKTTLAINKAAAGAGVLGLVGFAGLLAVASVFFVTENFFIAMMLISFALLVYVTGAEVMKLTFSLFTVFFSRKHVISEAAHLQETLVPLSRLLMIRRDAAGQIQNGPIEPGATIRLPDNPLVRDIKTLLEQGQGIDTAEYISHDYYVECHELYDYSSAHLEFVAGAMPLFGLIGTILGLIGIFDSLGAEVTVEFLSPQLALALKTTLYGALFSSIYKILASRFEQRLKALEYDFETLCRALQMLVENKITVEIRR
jgi:chemotaxis protein MotA